MRLLTAVMNGAAGTALLYVAFICLKLLLQDEPLARGRELSETAVSGLYGAAVVLGTSGIALVVPVVAAFLEYALRLCFGFLWLVAFLGQLAFWHAARAFRFFASLPRSFPRKERFPRIYRYRRP